MKKITLKTVRTTFLIIVAIIVVIVGIMDGLWFFNLLFGLNLIALAIVEWRNQNCHFSLIPISIIVSILVTVLSYQYTIMTSSVVTMELPGVIKEKHTAGAGSRSYSEIVYKTAIEVRENNDTYIITLDDESLFNSHIVGDEVTIKKEVTTKKKDNSVLSTNFSYAK